MTTEQAPRVGAVGRARRSVAAVQTLATLRSQGRTVATDAERETLAGWSGWGPLAKAFAPEDDTWVEIAGQLKQSLPADDLELGMQGTYNAFYTPEPIAQAMWQILTAVGFTGGRVLEPGCGGGVFMRTAPPAAAMTGVERDPTSAAICRLLYPHADIITGQFQHARMRDGFAAAVGNVPFGDVKVHDVTAPNAACASLHDYFIWRAVDLLAPGGVAVLLTSRWTMDKAEVWARKSIAEMADLVGAFRLPNGALAGGTDVVADVLVLRRKTGQRGNGFDWIDVDRTRFGWNNPVNKYWASSPLAVLGDMSAGRTTQYGLSIEVKARPQDPPTAQLITDYAGAVAVTAQARGLWWEGPVDVSAAPPSVEGLVSEQGWHHGSLHFYGDGIVRVEGGQLTPVARPSQELKDLLKLRDLAVTLVAYESDHEMGDRLIDPVRTQVAKHYAAYVRKYGAINRCTVHEGPVDEETGLPTYTRRTPPMGGFRKDPDAALVFALEVYDDETSTAGPAPILGARQNLPVRHPERTSDPRQALGWSLNRSGKVDLEFMAGLLGVDDPAGVPPLLGDALYQDPATRVWMTAEEYLSGNVRAKLEVAELAAGQLPEQFTRNVEALKVVLPPWLGPGEIGVKLGSPWIGADDIAEFIRATLGSPAQVRRVQQTSQWEVDASRWSRERAEAVADWGTFRVDAYQLIELALNSKVPVVYDTYEDSNGVERKRKNPDASMLANQKQQQIKERFAEWIWLDPDRTDRLVHLYNTRFNCLVARQFNGEHITVDGLAPWFQPYAHQREYVARALATPAGGCGHPVGAGKTATMAMVAMKLRQLGLIRKPMTVVPNHLKDQIEREFRQLFPGARILAASAETIAAGRRAFNARCATQEWDMILVTHSAFDRMAVSPQTESAYLAEELSELREAIVMACPDGKLSGRMVKNLAKRKDALEEKLDELKTRAKGFDLGLTFEAMGIDYLQVDEAHYYKNLSVPVRTDGFSVRPSKRATGLEIKLRWLAKRGNGRFASLYSGTFISNTMLELYVVLRYLMFDYLADIGLGNADAWAQTFVEFVTSVDVTVDGGQFQLVTRPALFLNAPELRMLLSQVADIRTAEQLGLKRPASTLETVVCQPSSRQVAYSADLVRRAEHVKSRGFVKDDNDKDNMLAICGDGRRMATDPMLVGIDDPEPGKLDAVADKMIAIWRKNPKSLQIGFCDVGTPNDKRGTQTYGRLRRRLIDRGMPAGLVRFIHDAKGDGGKAALFGECRADGKVSVILGSTDKLGVGTNIQRRVLAMHHIDAPWRPADVEQRDGRGLRPGNSNPTVYIYRYVTSRTFDAYTWQLLTRKIGFISQVVSGKVDRTVEDISADVVDLYAAVKAAATDQPMLLEKAKTEQEVKRLRGLQRGHNSTVDRLNRDITKRREDIRAADNEALSWEAIAAATGTEVADLDDEQASQLHELAKQFHTYYRAAPQTFAGVQVKVWSWTTRGDQPEKHPMLHIQANQNTVAVQLQAYKFWTPQKLATEFVKLLRGAATQAAKLRADIARWESENEAAQTSASRPFAQADQLTEALARLDQLEAALYEAALKTPDDAPPASGPAAAVLPKAPPATPLAAPASSQPVPVEPEPKEPDDNDDDSDDLGGLDDLAGMLGALAEQFDKETIGLLEDMMAGLSK